MPGKRYSDELLRRLRNEIPTERVIKHLRWPNKQRDGRFVFRCPECRETESGILVEARRFFISATVHRAASAIDLTKPRGPRLRGVVSSIIADIGAPSSCHC